jgi:hypothetical protein
VPLLIEYFIYNLLDGLYKGSGILKGGVSDVYRLSRKKYDIGLQVIKAGDACTHRKIFTLAITLAPTYA